MEKYRKEIDELIIKICLRQISNDRWSVSKYIFKHFDYLSLVEQSRILCYMDDIHAIRWEG